MKCYGLLTVLLVAYSNQTAAQVSQSVDRFVTVGPGVKLEVVDWGGDGRAVVLLAGQGVTAHGLDTLARALATSYHVFGLTRRGFPPSSVPTTGYRADQLANDVLTVLDSLHLPKPVLIGHSVAGEELSSIGSRFPERVAGLVYLEAGYSYAFYNQAVGDYRIELNEVINATTRLSTAAPKDQAVLIAQLLETTLPSFETGLRTRQSVLATSPPNATPAARDTGFAVPRAILEGHQRHTNIRAPVLAIYAVPHRTPATVGTDSVRLARWRASQDLVAAQADAFERGVAGARVVRIPNADHFVYRSNAAEVLREIRLFIQGLPR